jgi:hypothetical protein
MDIKNLPVLILFPNYFKKIGVALIIITALVFLYLIIDRPVASQQTKNLVKLILHCSFSTGVFLISIAKERIENQHIKILRLKIMSISLVFGIIYGIVEPLISRLLGSAERIDALELIDIILIFYMVLFYILKRSDKKEL